MFKTKYKYYKQKNPTPDFKDVLDFRIANSIEGKVTKIEPHICKDMVSEPCQAGFFKPVEEWNIYKIKSQPGIIFVKNPWTTVGQRYWIARCLSDYTKKPSKLNLEVHNELSRSDIDNWWEVAGKDEYQCGGEKGLMKKLRWATLGYHHDWDSKVYSEENKSKFPKDLWLLNNYLSFTIGCGKDFNAEAAILNFYHPDSTLSGHRDVSERDLHAPLFSFSFGLSALFLIGGPSLDDDPVAMFIDSGDIVVMFDESRTSYHAVPRILTPDVRKIPEDSYNGELNPFSINWTDSTFRKDFNHRLLRKIIDFNEAKSENNAVKDDPSLDGNDNSISNVWEPFNRYIKNSRINMNVRQVLLSGECKFPKKNMSDEC